MRAKFQVLPKIVEISFININCENCGSKLQEDSDSNNHFCINESCPEFLEYKEWTNLGNPQVTKLSEENMIDYYLGEKEKMLLRGETEVLPEVIPFNKAMDHLKKQTTFNYKGIECYVLDVVRNANTNETKITIKATQEAIEKGVVVKLI